VVCWFGCGFRKIEVGERREGREGFSTAKLSTQPNIEKEGNLRFFMRL
jgi:hypothetical protein